jgi:heme/copper-type cytochrome/quinol oxidase subunit 3
MSELARESTPYSVVEREPPRVLADNLRVAARLWSSSTAFFFFAFLFAYFYLRSLNQDHLWRGKHVHAPVALGTLEAAAVAGAAVLLLDAVRHHRGGRATPWRIEGVAAIGLLLAALGFQIAAWATIGFGPTDGGYASVYVGWTSFEAIFIVGFLYWVETTLATSLRHRKEVPYRFAVGEAAGDPHRANPDIEDPISVVRAQLEGLSFFGAILAIVFAISWLVLYLL